MPGKFIAAADVKEFEGAASSGAGGNVAKGASRQQQMIGEQRKRYVYVRSDGEHVDMGVRTYGRAWKGQ